jgi:hypothetical protein
MQKNNRSMRIKLQKKKRKKQLKNISRRYLVAFYNMQELGKALERHIANQR